MRELSWFETNEMSLFKPTVTVATSFYIYHTKQVIIDVYASMFCR